MVYSVIIPVYNEAENIEQLYRELRDVLDNTSSSYEIIFVDDGSRDRTSSVLNGLGKIVIITLRKNYGQTAALSAGILHSQGDYLITLDGDLQNNPADIPRLIQKLEEGYDVVCGWRKQRRDTSSKRFVSWGAAVLRRSLIDDGIHDSGCTLRIYRKECFEELSFGLYGEMHRFIPGILKAQGFIVGEVEVNHRQRVAGRSKYSWIRVLKGFVDMVILFFWRKYSARPMHVFGGLGLLSSLLGLAMLIVLFFLRLFNFTTLSDRVWPLVSILLIIVGVQLFASGIIADIVVRIYYSKDGLRPYSIKEIIKTR